MRKRLNDPPPKKSLMKENHYKNRNKNGENLVCLVFIQ